MPECPIPSEVVAALAALLGAALGEFLSHRYSRNRDRLEMKRDVLRRLMGYRWQLTPGRAHPDGGAFTALNEIPVVFAGEEDVERVADALFNLRVARVRGRTEFCRAAQIPGRRENAEAARTPGQVVVDPPRRDCGVGGERPGCRQRKTAWSAVFVVPRWSCRHRGSVHCGGLGDAEKSGKRVVLPTSNDGSFCRSHNRRFVERTFCAGSRTNARSTLHVSTCPTRPRAGPYRIAPHDLRLSMAFMYPEMPAWNHRSAEAMPAGMRHAAPSVHRGMSEDESSNLTRACCPM